MKTIDKFSEFQLSEWIEELQCIQREFKDTHVLLHEKQLVSEQEACRLLSISERTMRRYRKNHFLHYIKINKQIYYLKFLLLSDLLERCRI